MLKNIFEKYKKISILIAILLIAFFMIILIKPKKEKTNETSINYEELSSEFKNIFDNSTYINEEYSGVVAIEYNVEGIVESKYDVKATIPKIKIENSEVVKKINERIYEKYVKKIIAIVEQSNKYTIYRVNFVAFVNDNIVSLAIKETIKEGSSAQRIIIETYNYNIEENKLVTLEDLMIKKNLNEEQLQDKIKTEINKKLEENKELQLAGYNVYARNIENEIYKKENIKEYFLGNDGILYIIFSYGNLEDTSEVDVVIF